MQKTYTHTPIGNSTRHRVVIRDVPSHGPEIYMRQFAFLSDLVNNGVYNGLMSCGPTPFQRLDMRHDGESWVLTMEATEDK